MQGTVTYRGWDVRLYAWMTKVKFGDKMLLGYSVSEYTDVLEVLIALIIRVITLMTATVRTRNLTILINVNGISLNL
jgi:hypothetical protein